MAEVKINLDNPLVQSLLTGDISGLEDLVGKILNAALEEKTKELVGAGRKMGVRSCVYGLARQNDSLDI